MRTLRKLILAGCLFASCLSLGACSGQKRWQEETVFAMDTYMDIRVWAADDGKAAHQLSDEINRVDRLLSVQAEGSEIRKINEAGLEGTTVSEETVDLLADTIQYCAATDGALNICLYPLSRAWGFTSDSEETHVVPSKEALELAAYCRWENIKIDTASSVVASGGTYLDLGAVGKGYVTDTCVKLLQDAGIESAILSLGGNIYAMGENPEKRRPWNVAIQNPREDEDHSYIGGVAVKDMAVVTSGDYQRYFEEDGTRYCHIIDPSTGAPCQNELASVTILAPSGLLADAMSTALFVMGLSEGEAYWRQHASEFQVIWVTKDMEVFATEGLKETLSVSDGFEVGWIEM